jgi:hypothetical protein
MHGAKNVASANAGRDLESLRQEVETEKAGQTGAAARTRINDSIAEVIDTQSREFAKRAKASFEGDSECLPHHQRLLLNLSRLCRRSVAIIQAFVLSTPRAPSVPALFGGHLRLAV